MAFEDYNYSLYNKYILKDPDNEDSENEETMLKRLQLKKLPGLDLGENQDEEYLPLKVKVLKDQFTDKYWHEHLDDRSETEKENDNYK